MDLKTLKVTVDEAKKVINDPVELVRFANKTGDANPADEQVTNLCNRIRENSKDPVKLTEIFDEVKARQEDEHIPRHDVQPGIHSPGDSTGVSESVDDSPTSEVASGRTGESPASRSSRKHK